MAALQATAEMADAGLCGATNSALPLFNKIERYTVVECAWGEHQIVELSIGELVKVIRNHTHSKIGGEVSHNDLKQIFSDVGNSLPSIEERRSCILLSIKPITAVIMHDRVIVKLSQRFDIDALLAKINKVTAAYRDQLQAVQEHYESAAPVRHMNSQMDYDTSGSFANSAHSRGPENTLAFGMVFKNSETLPTTETVIPRFVAFPLELQLLELLMNFVYADLKRQVCNWDSRMQLLAAAIRGGSLKKNHFLQIYDYKEPIQTLKSQIEAISRALDELVDSDERMFSLQLTKIFFRRHYCHQMYSGNGLLAADEKDRLEINPNTEVLVEHLGQEVEILLADIFHVYTVLENLESLVKNKINMSRNTFQLWEVTCTIFSVGIAASSSISGIFGMNLKSHMEESSVAFYLICTFALALVVSALAFSQFFRKRYGY